MLCCLAACFIDAEIWRDPVKTAKSPNGINISSLMGLSTVVSNGWKDDDSIFQSTHLFIPESDAAYFYMLHIHSPSLHSSTHHSPLPPLKSFLRNVMETRYFRVVYCIQIFSLQTLTLFMNKIVLLNPGQHFEKQITFSPAEGQWQIVSLEWWPNWMCCFLLSTKNTEP